MLFLGLVVDCASYSNGGGNPHVAEAVTHAQAAKKRYEKHSLDAGIAKLGKAITRDQSRHADVVTNHAKAAVMHLKEIKESGLL